MAVHRVRFLSRNRPGSRMGMGHYERLLLRHLVGNAGAHWQFSVTFDGRGTGPEIQLDDVPAGCIDATALGYSTLRLARLPWWLARTLTGAFCGPRPALYHSLSLLFPVPRGTPGVYTVHDLPPTRFDDEGQLPIWAKRAARAADMIILPSRFAANEVHELLGVPESKLRVVPNGCEHDLFHPAVTPATREQLQTYGVGGPFVVYVGGASIRKNVAAMLEAWKAVATRHSELSLLLVGPHDQLMRNVAAARAPRAFVAGYLGRGVLPSVVKAAEALVCPSIYEGFGLPPLEAMALGVPVIAVRQGAIPEVVGEAALLADNGSVDSLAQVIQTLISDPVLRAKLREEGPAQAAKFDWGQHARQVLQLYEQLTGVA